VNRSSIVSGGRLGFPSPLGRCASEEQSERRLSKPC